MKNGILSGISLTSTYKRLLERFCQLSEAEENLPLLVEGVSDGALYSLIYSLSKDIKKVTGKPLGVITGEERRANKINELFKRADLVSEFYPVRDFNFYDMTASHSLEYERLKVLSGVSLNTVDVVIGSPDAFLQYTMPKSVLEARTLEIKRDATLEIFSFTR